MADDFVDDNFVAPVEDTIGKFVIRQITVEDAAFDFEALMANREMIWQLRGRIKGFPNWPSVSFTLDENKEDMVWLENDMKKNKLFCYLLISSRSGEHAGCVYLYPISDDFSELKGQYDVDFSMWVVKDVYDSGEYPELYLDTLAWVKDNFPFIQIYERNIERPTN